MANATRVSRAARNDTREATKVIVMCWDMDRRNAINATQAAKEEAKSDYGRFACRVQLTDGKNGETTCP
jgi:hypothetical protein